MPRRNQSPPSQWSETEVGGVFVAKLVEPRAEALKVAAIAAALTAVAIAHPFVFGIEHYDRGEFITPLFAGLLAVMGWYQALAGLLPTVTFRVEGGRFTIAKGPVPALRTVSLALDDVVGVRAVERRVRGKRISYTVWDLIVDERGGASHPVKLSWVPEDDAAWVAKRLTAAIGKSM